MAKAKAKANNKLKIFLYAFITVMTILALFLAWTLYVLTDFTNGGPKTVDSTQDYYSIPPQPPPWYRGGAATRGPKPPTNVFG